MSKCHAFWKRNLNPITMHRDPAVLHITKIDLTAEKHPAFANRYKNLQV